MLFSLLALWLVLLSDSPTAFGFLPFSAQPIPFENKLKSPSSSSSFRSSRIRKVRAKNDEDEAGPSWSSSSSTTTSQTPLPSKKRQQQSQPPPPQKQRMLNSKNDQQNSLQSSNANLRRLNQQLARAESAGDVLRILQVNAKLSRTAAGGSLNSVNFSTALHRLARHCVNSHNNNATFKQTRAAVLADPRTALLLASLGEAMASSSDDDDNSAAAAAAAAAAVQFRSRELSNIGWALAKLKLPPPASVVPIIDNNNNNKQLLAQSAAAVRQAVLQVAANRAAAAGAGQKSNNKSIHATVWMKELSVLSGRILDFIGATIVANNNNMNRSYTTTTKSTFQMQEWANLLWAWATADRADPNVFGIAVRSMIQQHRNEKQKQASVTLRPQEWSNSIWAFATAQIYNGHQDLLSYLAELLETHPEFIDEFKSQELSNTVWGVATLLSNKPVTTANAGLQQLTSVENAAALTILRRAAASVVARIRTHAKSSSSSSSQQSVRFRTQELSNTLWGLATLGFGLQNALQEQLNNNYVVLTSDQLKDDARLMQETVSAIVDKALTQLPRFWSQELNNVAWALARLVGSSSSGESSLSFMSKKNGDNNIRALLQGIGRQLADRRRQVTSQDIGTTLWSFATLEFFDDEIYRGLAARLTHQQAFAYKPQELSNSLWAFATAGMEVKDVDVFDTTLVPPSMRPQRSNDPVTICFSVAAQELMRRPQQFKSQEIKDVLWSFSKVGIRHPALFKSVAEHLVGAVEEDDNNSSKNNRSTAARGMDEFSPQGLGNMVWAFARQAQLVEDVSDRLNINNSNGRLAVYRTSNLDIGELLLHRFFAAIAESRICVHDDRRKGKPQDIANTAWAFAVLGLKNTQFMEATMNALVDRCARFAHGERNSWTEFKGQELANVLWALATLNVSSPGNLMEAIVLFLQESCKDSRGQVTTADIAKSFNRQELANMAWACAVFGVYPEKLMSFLYMGLVGRGEEQDPSYMASLYNDSGLQSQAVMTLLYVQAALDLQGCCKELSLPVNFPDGWQQKSSRATHDDHMTELPFELNLNTSKIQQSVSAAFSRIGFEHVDEHTITMEELARDFGVRIAPKQMEILSIDIANLNDRIAIEVDGPAHFISRINGQDTREIKREGGFNKIINGKMEFQFLWTGDIQEINGPTALKQRLLNSLGWTVIHLPFWEWYALRGDALAEESYCRKLLERVVQK